MVLIFLYENSKPDIQNEYHVCFDCQPKADHHHHSFQEQPSITRNISNQKTTHKTNPKECMQKLNKQWRSPNTCTVRKGRMRSMEKEKPPANFKSFHARTDCGERTCRYQSVPTRLHALGTLAIIISNFMQCRAQHTGVMTISFESILSYLEKSELCVMFRIWEKQKEMVSQSLNTIHVKQFYCFC